MNPDPNIFMFEYWIDVAIAAQLTAYGIIDPAKQRDDKGLITPRVEVKTIWNGFLDHKVPTSSGGSWFDLGRGKIAIKCVTRRNDPSQSHTRLVGSVRWMMNSAIYATPGYIPGDPNPITISDRMPYHRFGRVIDTGAVPQFVGNELQDVTALSFDFMIQIRTENFPS